MLLQFSGNKLGSTNMNNTALKEYLSDFKFHHMEVIDKVLKLSEDYETFSDIKLSIWHRTVIFYMVFLDTAAWQGRQLTSPNMFYICKT